MLNLVLFGPPGAGKGTQSQKIIDTYGLTHLSTGDILRSEIARGTALGMEAKSIMDKGDLVSDDIVIGMIESQIDANPNAKGFIFDGFPRTQAQAVALDDLLQKKGTAISAMLALEVENEELVKRLLLRGKDSGRADDQNENIIRNRINEYNNKTLPLKKYYSEQAKYHAIHGIGTVNSIFNDLCTRITFIKAEIELTMLENDIEHLDLTINDFDVATEISEELKQDIVEVRKAESNKPTATPQKSTTQKKVTKKIIVKAKPASKKEAAKKNTIKQTASKPSAKIKKAIKPTAKKVIKKVVKVAAKKAVKVAPKKTTSRSVATVKKVIKPSAKKATTKKLVKVAPKKVASKTTATKTKKVTKPVAKKVAVKKVVKITPKKVVAKKVLKKKK